MIMMMGVCWMLGLRWVAVVLPRSSPRPHPRPLSRPAGEGGVFLAGRDFGWCLGGVGGLVVAVCGEWGEWWFLRGSLSFCEGALCFLRGAWAVHERPLRGAFSFLVGVLVVWGVPSWMRL